MSEFSKFYYFISESDICDIYSITLVINYFFSIFIGGINYLFLETKNIMIGATKPHKIKNGRVFNIYFLCSVEKHCIYVLSYKTYIFELTLTQLKVLNKISKILGEILWYEAKNKIKISNITHLKFMNFDKLCLKTKNLLCPL